MKITTISEKLKEEYGQKIYKLTLSSGCTCPNRDGKISYGGCTFCSEGGSGEFASALAPIGEQIEEAKARISSKMPSKMPEKERRYIAYFQSFTNTYGDSERLFRLYKEVLEREEIVALSIGTRPDCLGDDILKMLSDLNKIKPVWVELGLQTIHEKTAKAINRGYELSVFEEAYKNLKALGITVIVHVILGLPGESQAEMLETVKYLAALNPVLDGIKLQLLHVLKGTKMGEEYEREHFRLMEMEEYLELVIKCLKLLPKETVIHRMTGDGPKKLLIGPMWSGNKKLVLNSLKKMIQDA